MPGSLPDESGSTVTRPAPTTVVYLAYGPPRFVWISAFSALTFMRVADQLPASRVVVYTDRPGVFRRFGVACDLIPLSALCDEIPAYHFRMKLTAMQHATDTYPGNVLFVDGDTYFTAPPTQQFRALHDGHAVMHVPDCQLGSPQCATVLDLEKLDAAGTGSQRLPRLKDWPEWIWNSGVIGIAEASKHLIPDVLAACDEIYAGTDSHISEQMAWTLVLSRTSTIVDAEDVVYHYWHSKEELMHEIVSFLRRNRRLPPLELATRAYEFRPLATKDWRPPFTVRARIAGRAGRRLLSQSVVTIAPQRREQKRELRPSSE